MVFVLAARIKPSTFDEFIIQSRGVGTMAFGSFSFFFSILPASEIFERGGG